MIAATGRRPGQIAGQSAKIDGQVISSSAGLMMNKNTNTPRKAKWVPGPPPDRLS